MRICSTRPGPRLGAVKFFLRPWFWFALVVASMWLPVAFSAFMDTRAGFDLTRFVIG
jgi:hypothetical protein